jgi:membrane protease YdiL (CAAX protease family)
VRGRTRRPRRRPRRGDARRRAEFAGRRRRPLKETPPVAYIAAIVGAAIFVEYVRRRRGGDDPLGPRPSGELPDTRWALVAGALAWCVLDELAKALLAETDVQRYGGFAAVVLVFAGVNLLVALGLLRAATRGPRRAALPGPRLAAVGVCAGLATFTAAFVIGYAITAGCRLLHHEIPEQAIVAEARRAGGAEVLVFALGAVVLAPFAEEVFFRGILLPASTRVVGERSALALQAIAFGLVHLPGSSDAWPLAIALAFVGWCAGFVYLRTGSLAAPMLLHATFNALNFAALRAG